MMNNFLRYSLVLTLSLSFLSCSKDEPNEPTPRFTFQSTNNSTEVVTAIEHAFEIWEAHLNINVPVKVNVIFTPVSLGFLGRSIPNGRKDFNGAPISNTWYPSALVNQLAGEELNAEEFDMDILMDGTRNWYYGIDGNPGSDQFDFVSVFLHEICHSLGFGSLSDIENGQGAFSVNPDTDLYQPSFPVPDLEHLPTIYDLYLANGNGVLLTDESNFGNPSTELATAFTSDDIFWNGPEGQSANDDMRPKVYAPATFRTGSSIGHLDESTYSSGTSNALMTPTLQEGEVIHEPGPIILGVLRDMGWQLKN